LSAGDNTCKFNNYCPESRKADLPQKESRNLFGIVFFKRFLQEPIMAKNIKNIPLQALPDLKEPGIFPFFSFRKQLLLLLLIGSAFYFNSLSDEYALDDGVMIKENSYVLEGFKGLGKIFSKHTMAAYYEKNHAKDEFEGGRYRPLSVATFAIEQSLFGMNPGDYVTFETDSGKFKDGKITGLDAFYVVVEYPGPGGTKLTDKVPGSRISSFHTETTARHVSNVLIYLLTIAFVFYFLREQVFRDNPDLGFLCALIFAIHPIHTEVVDNIKSRDELLALLFVISTFVFAFKNAEKRNPAHLFLGLASLFLALLSKEYGFILFALLPLFFYIVQKKSAGNSVLAALPYFAVMVVVFIIRMKIIPLTTASSFHATEVLNNQYIAAHGFEEKFASKISVLARYLWLLIFPYRLCVDYSYNQIPFFHFRDLLFWFSLLVHIGIVAATIILFRRRHILSFFLLFYLAHLFLISNLWVEIGTTLGERLIYLPSFAFSVILGYGLYLCFANIEEKNTRRYMLLGISAILIILCGFRVITRNRDWKNDASIFTHDLALAPNSILVNGNAGKGSIDMSNIPENKLREAELVKLAIPPLRHALALHPTYINGYLNLGVAYFKLGMLDSTYANWLRGHEMSPNNPLMGQYANVFASRGLAAARKNDLLGAIDLLSKAVNIDPNNPDTWANLGGAYYTVHNFEYAKQCWEAALKLNPNHSEASRGYAALRAMMESAGKTPAAAPKK
jgi:tetratricopeptide (TPR) repeat protein